MGARRRSVPGAQVSFLDAETRPCSTCKGAGVTDAPAQVRPVFTVEQAQALLERRSGDAYNRATLVLALAVDRGLARAAERPQVTCSTCGGTTVVTILPR